jgi:hypothetical protein
MTDSYSLSVSCILAFPFQIFLVSHLDMIARIHTAVKIAISHAIIATSLPRGGPRRQNKILPFGSGDGEVIRQKVGIFEWVVNEETWALNETNRPSLSAFRLCPPCNSSG